MATSWAGAVAIGSVSVVVLAGVAYLNGWLVTEPEVVHDEVGTTWYRTRGDDAHQQAIEACFRLDRRQTYFEPRGIIEVGRDMPSSGRFCCKKELSAECDLPRGHQALVR